MDLSQILYFIDLTGTFVFAVSGVTVASRYNVDVFGASVIGFVTALGGGTVRDVLIGATPVNWILNDEWVLAATAGIIIGLFVTRVISQWKRTMFIFDTIGIGLFTILGLEKTLQLGLSPIIALMMGTVSAVFGGVVRDVLVNRVPLIFRKEVYATACIAGGLVYLFIGLFTENKLWPLLVSIGVVITIRRLAVMRNWSLPMPKSSRP
ncbi:trimeric intracellular cation channel family protein [Sanyastnella coralliicola]|uniref:trimeric intracellular cation channel family protein n=1 Tax=Sanyastnella coralliicola TaxID=3069118 RepID=UPI0027B9AEDC|nr:trimeric intracellular cation channel family protein [Longitalea sp. SCSIO 12813]